MPTERQLYRMYGGGGEDYPTYDPPQRRSSLLDLTMQQGQIRADAARQSGDLWGSTIANIGAGIGQALEKRDAEKKMKRRDAAWVDFVGRGDWANDPKKAYGETLRIWGPEEGPKQFQALAGVSQLMQPKRNEAADAKALAAVGGAMGKMDDAGRAALWPQAVALTKGAFPHVALPPQYDPQVWKQVEPLFAQLSGDKAEAGYTLSPGQQRFDANGKQIAAVPPEVKEGAGFSLSPGEVRYDASGQQVASRPAAPREPKTDNEPLVAIMGPDGNPVLVPRSQAAGKRPASNREQGRPVVSGDANRLADLDTSLNDLATLSTTLDGNKATGALAKAGSMLPNVVTEFTGIGEEAKSKQATIDRVKQVIGKALEGGVLRKEDESKYEKILPTIGDPPAVVKSKLEGLQRAIEQRRQTLTDSLGDAGYDVSRFQARGGGTAKPSSKAEFDALPSGALFEAPDGTVRRKP